MMYYTKQTVYGGHKIQSQHAYKYSCRRSLNRLRNNDEGWGYIDNTQSVSHVKTLHNLATLLSLGF